MIFIIPLLIGAIGIAVGAVGGAFAAHAAGEKDRQASKHHRKVSDELNDKYSKLQQDYYELGDKSKAENKRLAISEVEKDALHLVVELQQAVIGLMVSIDESPSYEALTKMHTAIKATNQVLSHLGKDPIQINFDYFDRNLNSVIATQDADIRELIAEDPNTSPLMLEKISKDSFLIREAVAYNTSTPDYLLNILKNDKCPDVSIAAEKI
jgi:plasmid segregation protein ParM